MGSTGLTEIWFAKNIVRITANAFSGCSALQAFTVLGDLTDSASDEFVAQLKDSKTTIYGKSSSKLQTLASDNGIPFTAVTSAADAVEKRIAALPALGDLKPADEALVGSVRFDYENLSDADKLNVSSASLNALLAAEDQLAALLFGYEDVSGGIKITNYIGTATELTIPAAIGGKKVVGISGTALDSVKTTLKSLTFAGKIDITDYASFNDFSALEKLTFAGDVGTIKGDSFGGCSALASIEFLGKVGKIDQSFSSGFPELESLRFAGEVGSIGGVSFAGGSKLSSLRFEGKVTTIGADSFSYCNELTELRFDSDVGDFDAGSFGSCLKLESVSIGGSVDTFEWNVFEKCSSLQSVSVAGNIGAIDGDAFSGCGKLKSFTVLGDLTGSASDEFVALLKGNAATLYGRRGSKLQAFAEKWDIPFIAVLRDYEIVYDQIAALPAYNGVSLSDKAKIKEARAAYDALSDDAKAKVDNYERLTAAEDEIKLLVQAAPVEKLIAALPDDITLSDKAAAEAARAAYDALGDGAKAKVENYERLTDAEYRLAALKAQADREAAERVNDLIAALPNADKLNLSDKNKVNAAQTAYDKLTPDQKALVSDSAKLSASLERLKKLEYDAKIARELSQISLAALIGLLVSITGIIRSLLGDMVFTF